MKIHNIDNSIKYKVFIYIYTYTKKHVPIYIRKLPTFHYSPTDFYFLINFFFVQYLITKITTSIHNDIKDYSAYGW